MKEFLYTIVSVMIGGILSFVFSYLLDRRRNKREEEVYIKRKREILYNKIANIIYIIHQEIKPHVSQEELSKIAHKIKKKRDEFHAEILLYASNEVKEIFFKIATYPDRIESLGDSPELSKARLNVYNSLILGPDSGKLLDLMRKEIGTLEEQKSKGFQCNLYSWIRSKFSAK